MDDEARAAQPERPAHPLFNNCFTVVGTPEAVPGLAFPSGAQRMGGT
jgi:hypothetical protein